jgi:hypothetical protein
MKSADDVAAINRQFIRSTCRNSTIVPVPRTRISIGCNSMAEVSRQPYNIEFNYNNTSN